MRSLVLTSWGRMSVEEIADPEVLQGHVLVDIIATGICGTDVHGCSGENGRRSLGQVMGHETVGRILCIDDHVDRSTGLREGQLVTVNPVLGCMECEWCLKGESQVCPRRSVIGVDPRIVSAFAERMSVPAHSVVALPETLPVEYGALVEPLSVGYHAMRRAAPSPSDRVLVVGGGPIGQACVLAAQRLGVAAVAVSEPNPYRRELVGRLGAIPVRAVEEEPLGVAVAVALDGSPNIVVDAVGTSGTVGDALAAGAPGSRVVLVGMGAEQVSVPAFEISAQERCIMGSYCYSMKEFSETASWVGGQPPGLESLVDWRTDFAGASEAFSKLATGEMRASKVLVYPGGAPSMEGA